MFKAMENVDKPALEDKTREADINDQEFLQQLVLAVEKGALSNRVKTRTDSNSKTSAAVSCKDEKGSCPTNRRLGRRVSFADTVGQELASIRLMTEGRDTPPNLDRYNLCHCFGLESSEEHVEPELRPQFLQPVQDINNFYHKLNIGHVALESVCSQDGVINGIIKVRNIAYEKKVMVRYSTDHWKSHNDVTSFYVNNLCSSGPNTSVFDSFSFQLEVEPSWQHLEFCIRFDCSGQTFWDNNRGDNYIFTKADT